MVEAPAAVERGRKTRLEILQGEANSECREGCDGKWKQMAEQILDRNGISKAVFAKAIYDLLEHGRSKYRNVLVTGPANCGKTFILLPLTVIYRCFSNPATATFAWMGVENAEIIFLNDFRWNAQIIPWHDLLLLLEGGLVHFPAPKTHYPKDLAFDIDTPVFATSKHSLIYITGGAIDETETEMMAVRWKQFVFQNPIPVNDQRQMPACGHCFSQFVLDNVNE